MNNKSYFQMNALKYMQLTLNERIELRNIMKRVGGGDTYEVARLIPDKTVWSYVMRYSRPINKESGELSIIILHATMGRLN